MSQFAVFSLLTLALGEVQQEIYNLRKGGEWKLRGLCSDFTPLEIRKKSGGEGEWQLFAEEVGEEDGEPELLATLQPPPLHHHHGHHLEGNRRDRRQLSGIGGDFASWAGGGVIEAVKRRGGGESRNGDVENTNAAKGQRTNIIYLGVQPEAMKGFGRSDKLREARLGVPVHPVPPQGLQRWTLVREDACLLQLPIPTLRTAAEVDAHRKEGKRGGAPPGSTFREKGEPLKLLLTSCKENEFTCHDGSCIPLHNLCDNVPDCPVMAGGRPNKTYDETRNCGVKLRNEILGGPLPFEPDLIIEHNSDGTLHRAPVTVNVSLLDFEMKGLSEVEHKFHAKFQLVFEWFERRITWHNLKEEETLNVLSEHFFQKLFVPTLLFKNTKTMERTKLDSETELFGRKDGSSKKPADKELLETALFGGSENPVVYSRSYFVEFTQDFDLHFYPFDKQLVTVEIGPTQPAIKLMPGLLQFVGSIDMRRFTVQSWSIERRIEGSKLKDQLLIVKVHLKRRVIQVF